MIMVSKSEIAKRIAKGYAREVYEHEGLGMFDVSGMRQAAYSGAYALHCTDLLPEHALHFMKNRDWEASRVWEILNDPKAPWDTDPILAVAIPDGTTLFIDGTHRVLTRWMLKLPSFEFFLCPFAKAMRPDARLFAQFHDWGHKEFRNGKFVDRA